jgi:hypothetical protein
LELQILFMIWCGIRVQLGDSCSNFISSWKFQSNFIDFHTLGLPWFIIQILSQILKSYNKEICSLFDSLQILILFVIFQAGKGNLWVNQFKSLLKIFGLIQNCYYLSQAGPRPPHNGPRSTNLFPVSDHSARCPICPIDTCLHRSRPPSPPPLQCHVSVDPPFSP